MLECSKTKVHNAIRATDKAETRGRPRKTTATFDRKLLRTSKNNLFASSNQLRTELEASVCSRTIRNRLIQFKLFGRVARKVPFLSKMNIMKRMRFATNNQTRSNWKNVLWSDETKINLFGSDGILFVRRPRSQELDPRYTIKTVKHGGGNILLWGCFS